MNMVKNIFNTVAMKWNDFINLKGMKSIFKILPRNIFVFIFLILSIFTLVDTYNNRDHSIVYQDTVVTGNIGEVYKDNVEFSIAKKKFDNQFGFNRIGIRVGTYQRKIEATYKFELFKGTQLLHTEKFSTKNLKDLSMKYFTFNTIDDKNLKSYKISITPLKASKGNSVTFMTNAKNNTLVLAFAKTTPFLSTRMFILFGFIIMFFGISYLINTKKIKHSNFLLLMLIYIIPILFITPPYQVPDEPYHFERAKVAAVYTPEKSLYDNFINREVVYPSFTCLNYSRTRVLDNVVDSSEIVDCMKPQKSIPQKDVSGTAAILGAVIPGVGVKIGDLLSDSPLIIFYIGRLICMFVSLLITYSAIKIVPKYKNLLLVLATMPMVIQAMVSYSYDSILNSVCLLFVALFIKLKVDKPKMSWRYISLLALLFVIILNIKVVYAPLAILLFLIPKECFNSHSKKWGNIAIIILVAIIGYSAISYLIGLGQASNVTAIINTASKSNFDYLMSNPLEVFNIAIETLTKLGIFYMQGLIGYFGWFYFKLHDLFIVAYLVLFSLLIFSEESILNIKEKTFNLICNIIIVIGVFAALYFSWSSYKSGYVEGVQGRYFLPLLLPIFMCFMGKTKKIELNYVTVYSFINIIMLQYIGLLLLNYY